MLGNERYNRALAAGARQKRPDVKEVFWCEEFITQNALRKLGITKETAPSDIPHVGTVLVATELFPGLRNPYAVEVLGMPRAGKSGILDRYLSVLRRRNERYTVALIPEGAESAREKYADERYTDPFSYSRLAGSNNFLGYINALSTVNQSIRMAISDRGQIDRRVFRRALFSQGDVNPDIMNDENRWMYYMEYTPIQVGGVIMVMVRPEVSFRRGNEKLGPVSNMDFLTKLYEQYWRLHYEILQGDPFPLYTCIDAEKDREQVYKEFEHVMDTALTIQSTFQTT